MTLEVAPGYKKVVIAGAPLTIGGNQVYHHAGRGEYAIERDSMYLTQPTATQQAILEHVLETAESGGADDLRMANRMA